MKLMYQHNIITNKIAKIFVTTNVRGIDWSDATKNGLRVLSLLKDSFEFGDDVKLFTDLSKREIIAELDHMQEIVDGYEEKNAGRGPHDK